MSYDISFRVQVHNTQSYINLNACDANTTWNLRNMIKESTGLEWINNQNNGFCEFIIPKIQQGLEELSKYPEKYKQYEDPDGWGTVAQCIHFFNWIINDWNDYVQRTDADVVKQTTFWIT